MIGFTYLTIEKKMPCIGEDVGNFFFQLAAHYCSGKLNLLLVILVETTVDLVAYVINRNKLK